LKFGVLTRVQIKYRNSFCLLAGNRTNRQKNTAPDRLYFTLPLSGTAETLKTYCLQWYADELDSYEQKYAAYMANQKGLTVTDDSAEINRKAI